ncbi:MAG TPA: MurR/RpiR family transcriptional regulator [Candidatus Erysipelatoclostridium merdavium]|uniref:MurR/RpiR family transcriptional regulator n=1 Tax=Candidatus Erysipelatoclostridium merdavium TaxID=2838566 RepID=A0A9D1XLL7_9FIRM|nr:MurR/RpiR family transcriptional regulator [Candidatus Erysipelatoclostridium merdavium]
MLIRERLERCEFSNSERVIIDFILKEKMNIKNMTMKEIANATYTSPSTLIRIAHKMKFKGWNELKEAYLKEEEYLQTHFLDIDANLPFSNDDTIMSIASKIATLKKEAIDDTLSLVRHDDLQKAVQMIKKASSIYVFAVSNNGLITQEFAHNMSRIKKKVTICNLQGELVYSAINVDVQSCAIIVSYSGETPILSRVIQALKMNGIPIIAITNIGENTVSRNADVVLRICTREKLYSKIATFSTDVSFEYILDLLYSCVFSLDYNKNLERKTKISQMIEKGRFSTIDIMKEDEF